MNRNCKAIGSSESSKSAALGRWLWTTMEFKVDCRRIAAKKGIDIRAGGDRFEPQVPSSGRLVPGRKSSEPGRRNKMTPSSTIEFLIWLLIAASIIAVIAARLTNSLYRRSGSGRTASRIISSADTAKPIRSFPRLVNTQCQFDHFSACPFVRGQSEDSVPAPARKSCSDLLCLRPSGCSRQL